MSAETGKGGPGMGTVVALLVVAAGAGAAAGWLLHGTPAPQSAQSAPASAVAPAETKGAEAASATSTPAPASAVPAAETACNDYKDRICKEAGDQSEACRAFGTAAPLLPASACQAGMAEIAATVTKIGAMRGICDELTTKLCNDLGPETQTCGLVKSKTPEFPADRCKSMMDEYPKVLAELQGIEKQNQPLSEELAAKQEGGDAPSYGPADAKVTVVEYSDFQCPYCSMAAKTATEIKKRYGNVVKFVFREYPLPFHQNAGPAAQASLAANAQGKFWEYHDLLFANQDKLDRENLEKLGAQVGLDVGKLKEALDKETHKAAVDADVALGQEVGVQGTPTMFVGRERVQNPSDFAAISKVIDKQLELAGVPVPPVQ